MIRYIGESRGTFVTPITPCQISIMHTRSPIHILATLRFKDSQSVPAKVSLAAYLYLITKTSNLNLLWELLGKQAIRLAQQPTSLVNLTPLNDLKPPSCSRKKALLIGVRAIADETEMTHSDNHDNDTDAATTAPDIPYRPRENLRRRNLKSKKKKYNESSQSQLCRLKGPHHDVLILRDLLISKQLTIGDAPCCANT